MQPIFEKCPYKENGKLSKLFRLVLRGLNLPAGSDTPQNKILWGIRPRRTRPCGVSDPAELSLVGYQTPQNNGKVVYILWHTLVLRGSDTLQNNVLRGLIPRLTKFCRVSGPAEQSPVRYQTPRNNIQKQIFLRIRKRIQKYFRVWIRGLYGVDSWKKTRGKKSRATVPLKVGPRDQSWVSACGFFFCV